MPRRPKGAWRPKNQTHSRQPCMPATQFDAQPAPSLPMDIVHRIASFLSPREWARGPVLTCRDFNAVSWDALELDTTWASPGPPPRWLLSRWAASRSLMIIDLEFKGSATLLEALASASAAPNLTQLELFTNNFPWSATDTSMRTKLGSGAPRNALTMLHPLLPALRELTAPSGALPDLLCFSRLQHLRLIVPENKYGATTHPDVSAVASLPELETLELAAREYRDTLIAHLDLRGLAWLRVLILRRVTPAGLALCEGVPVRLHNACTTHSLNKPVWQGVHVQHIECFNKDSYGAPIRKLDLPSRVGLGHVESICIDGGMTGVGDDTFDWGAYGLKCLCIPLLQHLQHLEILTEGRVELLIPACMPLRSLVVMAFSVYLDIESWAGFAERVDMVKLGWVTSLHIPEEGPPETKWDRQQYGWDDVNALTVALQASGKLLSRFCRCAQVLRERPLVPGASTWEEGDSDEPDEPDSDDDGDGNDPRMGTILLYERMHGQQQGPGPVWVGHYY